MQNHLLTCQVCGSTGSTPVYAQKHPGLQRCNNCGFVYFTRVPTLPELINHYKSYSRNDSISPITIKRYEELLHQFSSYHKLNRILDVGCGNGHLLKVASDNKWEVYGTEFTDEAIAICESKGIQMKKGELQVSNYDPESFDVITFIEVIEHIQNGPEELQKFHQLLRKGGVLYITTPNFKALSGKIAGADWNIIEYPEHLSYYSKSNLDRLLKKSGFEKISLRTTGFSYNRIVRSKNTDIKTHSNFDETLRTRTESSMLLNTAKKILNGGLSLTGTGDTIKALYKKV